MAHLYVCYETRHLNSVSAWAWRALLSFDKKGCFSLYITRIERKIMYFMIYMVISPQF